MSTPRETPPGIKVRITQRIISHLEGSQAWADRNDPASREGSESRSLMRKVAEAHSRKDGSITVLLTLHEAEALYDQADILAVVSRDDAGPEDLAALGELNAARALLRQLAALGVK